MTSTRRSSRPRPSQKAARSTRRPATRTGLNARGKLAFAFGVLVVLVVTGPFLLGLVPALQKVTWPAAGNLPAQVTSFVHFGAVGWLVAALLLVPAAVRARRRAFPVLLAALALVGLGVQASWLAPKFVGPVPAVSQPLQVMSLNVLAGHADPRQIVARAAHADVVVLLELTPTEVQALDRAGLTRRFPHHVGAGRDGVGGTGVYSRWPITQQQQIQLSFQQWIVTVDTPGHGPVTVAAVHPINPMGSQARWAAEGQRLSRELRPHLHENLIVAGDFNAINRHYTLRLLTDAGLRDAAVEANAGWLPTWPDHAEQTRGYPLPPLIEIDHVLTGGRLHASRLTAFSVDGTDHRGLLATVG